MPADFLMQQMAWREALDEARTAAAVGALAVEVTARQQALQNRLAVLLDQQQDWAAAATQIRALMFMACLLQDVDSRQDAC